MAVETTSFYNVGPGDVIRDGLEALGWTQDDLAEITGMTPKSINLIIKNKQTITVETAKLFAKVFNTSAEVWMNLDSAYQLRKHQGGPREKLTEIKAKMRRYMPLAEMRKKGWLKYDDTVEGLTKDYERLWGTDSVDESVYEIAPKYCARRSKVDEKWTQWYSATWYRVARIRASHYEIGPYDPETLKDLLGRIGEYTLRAEGVSEFLMELNNCGVGFFVLSHLQKTYLDGAAFLYQGHPFIVYTGRHNRVDNFWYTLCHEAAHVLLHLRDESLPYLDDLDGSGESAIELEADALARRVLNVEKVIEEGKRFGNYLSADRLEGMSKRLNLSVPLILGILQYAKVVEWRKFVKFRETVLDKIL